MEDSFGESQLVGAVEHKPSTPQEFLKLIETSMSFRKTAATLKNDTSSRSHAVCRIRISNKNLPEAPDGLLYLVDLAGSELGTDSKEHSQERMKETREINISLSTLKDCIR
jgi:kinesin family protein 2/24